MDHATYASPFSWRYGRTELRACYPLDIIDILTSIGRYEKRIVTVTRDDLQRAAGMYFAKA